MKDFNENFKKELKDSFENIEVKTSADTILNKFKSKQEAKLKNPILKKPKKAWFESLIFGTSVAALLIAIGIGSGYGIAISKISGSETTDISTSDASISGDVINNINLVEANNQIHLELITSLSLINLDDTGNSFLPISLLNNYSYIDEADDEKGGNFGDGSSRPTKLEFGEIVDIYDRGYKVYDSLFNFNSEYSFNFIEGSYAGKYKEIYKYKASLNENTYFLADIDFEDDLKTLTSFKGEVVYSEASVFKVEGEVELDGTEYENQLKIYKDDDSFISIELVNEGNKQTYQYSVIENGKEEYFIEILLRKKNNKTEVVTDIVVDKKSYNFKSRFIDYKYDVDYRYLKFNGRFQMEIIDSNRIYSDKLYPYTIVK